MTKPSSDSKCIRIVLADDHVIVREGLKLLLETQEDMCVVGEATDGETAYRLCGTVRPDILIIDLSMPILNGVDTTERVCRDYSGIKVLALTVHEERLYLTQIFRAGASGYVLKRAVASELIRAIRSVMGGDVYVDPSIAGMLVKGYLDADKEAQQSFDDTLSERERDVLIRISQGFSNKEIASALQISIKTVETYKARVAEKLGLRSRVDIVRYASQRGWLRE